MKSLWIIAMVCVARSALGEDLTLKEREVGTDVVEAVIDILGQSCVFSDDRHILRRIAKVETDDGNANDTFTVNGQDYYGGIWRVTQSMFDVAKSRSDLYVSIINAYDIDFSKADYTDLVKPLYSGLAARIYIDSTPTKGNEIPWSIDEQASYWALTYHQFSSSVTAQNYMYLDVIDLLASVCSVPRADIVFVLDGSSSIEAANFQTMLRFVQEVVENFDVEQDGVHIGVIQYSHFAETEFYPGEITDKGAVKTKVQSIEYNRGNTYTNASLDAMREMFAKYGRRASGVPQIGIVLTDGKSTNKTATVAAAQMVHDEKLTVFAIGVSGADISELNTIGTDPDCVHVHFLNNFSDMAPFTSTIQAQACSAPAELDPGYEFSGTLEYGVKIFFKVKIFKGGNGTTITLKLSTGCGILYVSFKARKPGPAVYEHLLRVDSALKEGGRLYLTYPTDIPDEGQEFVEAFLALVGDCHVAANNFTIELNEGGFTEIITLNTTGTTEGHFNRTTNRYTTGTTKGNAAYGLQPVLLSLLAGLMLALCMRA